MVYILVGAFTAGGVLGAREIGIAIDIWGMALAVLCTALFCVAVLFPKWKPVCIRFLLGILLIVPCIGMGYMLSLHAWRHIYSAREYASPKNKEWKGVIVSDISEGGSKDTALMELEENGNNTHSIRALVRLPLYTELRIGDRVAFLSSAEIPDDFLTDAGLVFPYAGYLAAKGAAFILKPRSITVTRHSRDIRRYLYAFRRYFEHGVHMIMSEMSANLVCGVLLGTKKGLTNIEPVFRRAGLTHILVLSGFNVTIVAVFIAACLSFLDRRSKFIISLTAIMGFALMVGLTPTVMRSVCMATLALWAGYIYRPYGVGRALAISGAAMVALNPLIATFDPSFQLSFISTIGLIVFAEPMQSFVRILPERFGIRELIGSTLAVLIFSTPFTLMTMGQVSIVALLSNILVTPCIPILMLLGFLATSISLIPTSLTLTIGHVVGMVADGIAQYVLFIGTTIGTWKIASVTFVLQSMPTALIYGSYAVLIYALTLKKASAASQFILAKKSST